MNINQIKPYPKNTKKHPKKQLLQIAKSIKEFGWQQPIVVDKNGVIIVGHGRYHAFMEFGNAMSLQTPPLVWQIYQNNRPKLTE